MGLGAAAALTRYLEGMLFGVTPLDPMTFVGVPLLLAAVAAIAASVPATARRNHQSERRAALRVPGETPGAVMAINRTPCRRLARLPPRAAVEQELDEELRAYLETAVEQKITAGMERGGALARGAPGLGGVGATRARVREVGWESGRSRASGSTSATRCA